MTSSVSTVEVITPPMTATPSGARNCAPSPRPSATGTMPAMRAKVVMRMGRRRMAPASTSASRSGIPCRSRAHLAKSMSRMAFLATIPQSRITPMSDIRLMVLPVRASAPITPISDSGSEMRMASGSRNDPNCTTRMRYISATATPSAMKIFPNTSVCCSTCPPCERRTPGGRGMGARRAWMSACTSERERPATLASTLITLSRSRWLTMAGPSSLRMRATCASGMSAALGPCPTATGSCARSAPRARASGASRTITLRVSLEGSTQSPASSPAKAGRMACATCPTLSPSAPASPRSTCTVSSGFCPLVLSPTSTAPRTPLIAARYWSATPCSAPLSVPRSSSEICFSTPAKSLVNTATAAPPMAFTSSRICAASSSAPRSPAASRSPLGLSLRNTPAWSTAPLAPPAVTNEYSTSGFRDGSVSASVSVTFCRR